jgi:hypothetical protein
MMMMRIFRTCNRLNQVKIRIEVKLADARNVGYSGGSSRVESRAREHAQLQYAAAQLSLAFTHLSSRSMPGKIHQSRHCQRAWARRPKKF